MGNDLFTQGHQLAVGDRKNILCLAAQNLADGGLLDADAIRYRRLGQPPINEV